MENCCKIKRIPRNCKQPLREKQKKKSTIWLTKLVRFIKIKKRKVHLYKTVYMTNILKEVQLNIRFYNCIKNYKIQK